MKVDIRHVEKKQGLMFKKTLHGVALTVVFNEEELAIIEERNLRNEMFLERGIPADVDAEKHENRGLVKMIATAAIKGREANHFHLTMGKMMDGTDTFFFSTPIEAKEYEEILKAQLPDLKAYIMQNASTDDGGSSFEL